MNITVYCGSNFGDNPHFEEAARNLGAWIARAGHTLVYGGSSVGLMGAVSRAAIEGGAPVIGVEPAFFIEAGVAQHDLTELFVVRHHGRAQGEDDRAGRCIRGAAGRRGDPRGNLGDLHSRASGHGAPRVLLAEYRWVLRSASLVFGIDGRAPLFRSVRPRSLPLSALRGRAGTPSEHRRTRAAPSAATARCCRKPASAPHGDVRCSDRASSAATETAQWAISQSEDCLSESEYRAAPPRGKRTNR